MRKSPFHHHKADSDTSEVHFLVKKANSIGSKAQETVTDLFPSANQVPHSIRFGISSFYVSVMIACFVGLVISGFYSTLRTEFLSPYDGKGSASPNCKLIPITYSGDYLSTQTGYWEGEEKFDYSTAAYKLSIISLSSTTEKYLSVISELYSGLTQIGALSANQELGANLMLWMSFAFANASSRAQRFNLVGTPLTVLDRDNNEGTISSILGNCNLTSTTTFDANSGLTTISYDYIEYMASPLCVQAINPEVLGYNTLTKPQFFAISYDVRTLVTGLAVNLGIIDVDTLIEITSFRQTTELNGDLYRVGSYYDPKYAGMTPINCIFNAEGIPLCAVTLGSVFAIPIFNHLGANLTAPALCNCSLLTAIELEDSHHNCNLFRFLSGFLFASSHADDPNYLFMLVMKHGTVNNLNRAAHAAMFIAGTYGQFSPLTTQLNSVASLAAAYDFCAVGNVSCALVTVTTYDTIPQNWAISSHLYQLQNGACRNTIGPKQSEWARFNAVPYAPLNQNYQQCKNAWMQTLLEQAGIAIGNVQIIGPLCILLLLGLASLYRRVMGVSHDESYSKNEKDAALEAYAMALLLARDEKLKTAASMRDLGRHSLIEEIVEELSEHTMMSMVSHKNKQIRQNHKPHSTVGMRSYARIVSGSRHNKVSDAEGSSLAVTSPASKLESNQRFSPNSSNKDNIYKDSSNKVQMYGDEELELDSGGYSPSTNNKQHPTDGFF